MNGIQEAIEAMTAEELGQLLAQAVPIIIGIWGFFAIWRQAKRLLNTLEDPYAEAAEGGEALAEHPDDFIDSDGQVWENGQPTGIYADQGDEQDEQSEAEFELPFDLEKYREEPEEIDDASDFDSPEEEEQAHYATYHHLLDESDDPEAAKAYAEEHGLDVDWDKASRDLIQSVIDRGDHDLARELIQPHGWSFDEFEWN